MVRTYNDADDGQSLIPYYLRVNGWVMNQRTIFYLTPKIQITKHKDLYDSFMTTKIGKEKGNG